jgi:hypothetical protein
MSITLQGAKICEQGVNFAIVIVKEYVLNNQSESESARQSYRRFFPGMHIILMAQDSHGIPTYSGRRDIVSFLAGISMSRIPWKEFTFSW